LKAVEIKLYNRLKQLFKKTKGIKKNETSARRKRELKRLEV
jgi:hypothetical protein